MLFEEAFKDLAVTLEAAATADDNEHAHNLSINWHKVVRDRGANPNPHTSNSDR